MNQSDSTPDAGLDRRSLLRSGSALLAGAAGLSAVGVAGAAPAGAAPGEAVLQGQTNNAGAAATELTSTSGATLKLDNTGDGAAMQVKAAPDTIDFDAYLTNSQSGDVLNAQGSLLFTHEPEFVGEVYTDMWANQVVPISPQRALDSRTASGRARIVNPTGSIDSRGRLIGGRSIEIDLADYVIFGMAGFFNLTIVGPTTGGHATLYPGGDVPSASSINFTAGQTIANGLVCGLSEFDRVSIFSARTTHVILDLSALWVGTPGQVNPAVFAGARSAQPSVQRRAAAPARVAPSWAPARLTNRR
jgi:hypothetical protein